MREHSGQSPNQESLERIVGLAVDIQLIEPRVLVLVRTFNSSYLLTFLDTGTGLGIVCGGAHYPYPRLVMCHGSMRAANVIEPRIITGYRLLIEDWLGSRAMITSPVDVFYVRSNPRRVTDLLQRALAGAAGVGAP